LGKSGQHGRKSWEERSVLNPTEERECASCAGERVKSSLRNQDHNTLYDRWKERTELFRGGKGECTMVGETRTRVTEIFQKARQRGGGRRGKQANRPRGAGAIANNGKMHLLAPNFLRDGMAVRGPMRKFPGGYRGGSLYLGLLRYLGARFLKGSKRYAPGEGRIKNILDQSQQ